MTRMFITVLLVVSTIGWSKVYAADDLNVQVENMVEQLTSLLSGEVVKGTETEAYIALGQKDGIMPGTIFEVIRRGAPLKVGEEIIGYEETPVGKVEVSKVREKMSICRIVEARETPKPGDRVHQMRKRVTRVLVGQFIYNQEFNALTKSLQEKLVTSLTNRGMQVVERDQLERVLKEQKLGYSGLVNSATAKKIGELFGAEGMILGAVSDFGNNIVMNGRLVDVETGNAISAAEIELAKTPMIAGMLTVGVEGAAPAASGPAGKKKTKSKKKAGGFLAKQMADGFEFGLQKCVNQGGTVTCYFKVASTENDKRLYIKTQKNRLFDTNGNVYQSHKATVANNSRSSSYDGADSVLVKGIPVNASITFPGVDADADMAAVVEIFGENIHLQFRDIPLTQK